MLCFSLCFLHCWLFLILSLVWFERRFYTPKSIHSALNKSFDFAIRSQKRFFLIPEKLKVTSWLWIESHACFSSLTIVPILHQLQLTVIGNSVRRLLKNEDVVCFLSNLGWPVDAAWVEVRVVFNFLGMHNQKDVHIVFGCNLTQQRDHSILQVKLLIAHSLVWKHKLQIV